MSEIYRDADTLGRLLATLGADATSLRAVDSAKAAALRALAERGSSPRDDAMERPVPTRAEQMSAGPGTPAASPLATIVSMFKVGDLVALRSTPNVLLPVMEVISGGAECRYRVFQNNAKTTYYESQLQAAALVADERKALTVRELHASL